MNKIYLLLTSCFTVKSFCPKVKGTHSHPLMRGKKIQSFTRLNPDSLDDTSYPNALFARSNLNSESDPDDSVFLGFKLGLDSFKLDPDLDVVSNDWCLPLFNRMAQVSSLIRTEVMNISSVHPDIFLKIKAQNGPVADMIFKGDVARFPIEESRILFVYWILSQSKEQHFLYYQYSRVSEDVNSIKKRLASIANHRLSKQEAAKKMCKDVTNDYGRKKILSMLSKLFMLQKNVDYDLPNLSWTFAIFLRSDMSSIKKELLKTFIQRYYCDEIQSIAVDFIDTASSFREDQLRLKFELPRPVIDLLIKYFYELMIECIGSQMLLDEDIQALNDLIDQRVLVSSLERYQPIIDAYYMYHSLPESYRQNGIDQQLAFNDMFGSIVPIHELSPLDIMLIKRLVKVIPSHNISNLFLILRLIIEMDNLDKYIPMAIYVAQVSFRSR